MHSIDWVVIVVIGLLMLVGSKAEYEVVADRINGGGGLMFFVCLIISGAVLGVGALTAAIFIGPLHGVTMAGLGAVGLVLWTYGLRLVLALRAKRR